jgi:hypothetical protein
LCRAFLDDFNDLTHVNSPHELRESCRSGPKMPVVEAAIVSTATIAVTESRAGSAANQPTGREYTRRADLAEKEEGLTPKKMAVTTTERTHSGNFR